MVIYIAIIFINIVIIITATISTTITTSLLQSPTKIGIKHAGLRPDHHRSSSSLINTVPAYSHNHSHQRTRDRATSRTRASATSGTVSLILLQSNACLFVRPRVLGCLVAGDVTLICHPRTITTIWHPRTISITISWHLCCGTITITSDNGFRGTISICD